MAKSNVFEWDTTAANNTDAGGLSCAEGMLPSNVNNWMREIMAQIRRELAGQGSSIASAATTSIAATGTSGFVHITGTTTITSFDTANAGIRRFVEFEGALTLTHNATALILPGGQNITTAAGDCAMFVSEGSGNWRCLFYSTASGNPVGSFSSVTATSTDAGATAGPDITVYRNSASPADNDLIGRYLFDGRDSAANQQTYAGVEAKVLDVTSATEDAEVYLKTVVAGTYAARLTAGQGVQIGSPTGGDKGAGTLNAAEPIYQDGVNVGAFSTQLLHVEDQKSSGTDGGTATSGAWRTRTLNTSVTNEITGASLGSNQVTLPAGTYYAEWSAPGFDCNAHQTRLWNDTDSAAIKLGSTELAGAVDGTQTRSTGSGRFTIAAQKVIELQHQVATTVSGDGFGSSAGFGTEVYSILKIWKL